MIAAHCTPKRLSSMCTAQPWRIPGRRAKSGEQGLKLTWQGDGWQPETETGCSVLLALATAAPAG